ncbi:hypothetical protein [Streptomyces ferrugineus]|uniref:hypothetical protein n=1 Tax=Streptomyces ferrugineus TaxID=1413221 RepID=UPI001D157CE4|nr:hypothetical protein [Streptomyces ferrugineus]
MFSFEDETALDDSSRLALRTTPAPAQVTDGHLVLRGGNAGLDDPHPVIVGPPSAPHERPREHHGGRVRRCGRSGGTP